MRLLRSTVELCERMLNISDFACSECRSKDHGIAVTENTKLMSATTQSTRGCSCVVEDALEKFAFLVFPPSEILSRKVNEVSTALECLEIEVSRNFRPFFGVNSFLCLFASLQYNFAPQTMFSVQTFEAKSPPPPHQHPHRHAQPGWRLTQIFSRTNQFPGSK